MWTWSNPETKNGGHQGIEGALDQRGCRQGTEPCNSQAVCKHDSECGCVECINGNGGYFQVRLEKAGATLVFKPAGLKTESHLLSRAGGLCPGFSCHFSKGGNQADQIIHIDRFGQDGLDTFCHPLLDDIIGCIGSH
jgi:hypothetical protein